MRNIFYILIIMLLPVFVSGQDGGKVELFGKTQDATTNRRLGGVEIIVYKDGAVFDQKYASSNGKYDGFKLPIGSSYKVEYKKLGYVSKYLNIDLSNIVEEDFGKYNLPMELDMTLFLEVEDVDFSLLENNPIGKAKWDPQAGSVTWDWAYTEKMKKQVDKLLKEVEKKQEEGNEKKEKFDELVAQGDGYASGGNYERALTAYQEAKTVYPEGEGVDAKITEMQQKIEEQKQAGQQYDQLIQQGDQAFNSGDFDKALDAYNQAIILKPDEEYPSNQIIKIEEKKAELERQKEEAAQKEQAYQNLVSAADNLMGQKEYDKAIEKYEEALTIKPSETYPKTKIAEIEGLQANAKQQEELEAKYNKLIADGDTKMSGEEYKAALGKYQEASTLKPNEQYPKDKIAEINTILEKEEAAAELNRKYDEAITKGDQFFTQEEYTSAKTEFQKALELKPNESYPKSKIAEIEKKLAEIEANKEKQAEYDGYIQQADNKFNSESWEEAKAKYNQALTVLPNESYPRDQIAKIEKKQKEIAEAEKLEEQFNTLVQEADQLYDNDQLKDAKSKYQAALELKSSATHPKARIAEINEKLREQANKEELEEQYNGFIAKADAAYQAQNYEEAKKQYEEALGVKPDESYPKTQLKAIEEAIEKQEEEALNQKYQALVAEGDAAFDQESYNDAKSKYNAALELKSNEQYPKDKIKAIDDLLAKKAAEAEEKEEVEEEYNTLIATADQLFNDKQWENAIKKYQSALDLKPNETHPKVRVEEANQKIKDAAATQEVEANYQAEIEKADEAMANKDYEESKNLYKKAAAIKPNETYPQEQIDKINDLMAKETNNQVAEQYIKIIDKADGYFDAKDYENAKVYYNRALTIKPDDSYPQDKLNEIAQIKKNEVQEEENTAYKKLILEADAMFEQKEWKRAKEIYKQAFKVKNDPYPQEQIDKINDYMKQETEGKTAEMYQKIIDKADQLFTEEKYEDARSYYVRAKNLKPSDSYPKAKIAEIDEKLALEAQMNKEVAMADYGDPVKDQSVMDGEALLMEAEAYRKHKAATTVKETEETYSTKKSGWTGEQDNTTKNMRDSSEMMRDKIQKNKENLGEITEKNEYEVGSYDEERQEKNISWNQYDETEIQRSRKQSEGVKDEVTKANVANDEPRKENELKVVENSDQIGKENSRQSDESYDASYDSRIQSEDMRTDISENYKNSDLDRQQNELDVVAFNEKTINTESEDESESYDSRINMRDNSEDMRTKISSNKDESDQDRENNAEDLVVYNDDRSNKRTQQTEDDYDEIIETTSSADELKIDITERNKNSDKTREKNTDVVIEEQEVITKKKSDIGDESYNQITSVRDEVEDTRSTIQESKKNSDKTREGNSKEVVDYQDENLEKQNNQGSADEDQMHSARNTSEEMRNDITKNKEKQGKLVDQNDEELEELDEQTKSYKDEVSEKSNDRQNNSFDLMDDNYRAYDPSKFDGEMANALAKEYPEGVTEKSYNVKNEDGLVTKVITRRIVIKGNRGDVYERIQTRFGLSYFKNGGAISEYVWQDETADAALTKHTE